MAIVDGVVRLGRQEAAAMARQIERAGADGDGMLRAVIDDRNWNFASPRNQQFPRDIDVFGPRGTLLENTPLSSQRGVIDMRTGDPSEIGDGIRWSLQFVDGATGEPMTNAKVAAWVVAPRGFDGQATPRYYPDRYRGVAELDEQGKVTILSHDPPQYPYRGSILDPHLHGMVVPKTGQHPTMVFEQPRMGEFPTGDLDVVEGLHVIPPGHPEGRILTGPWDPHRNAVTATSGEDAGFILPSKAPALT